MKLNKLVFSIMTLSLASNFIYCTNKDKAALPPAEKKEELATVKKDSATQNEIKTVAQSKETQNIVNNKQNETKENENLPHIPAILKAENQSALSFLTTGKIVNIYYRAGDYVKQGQTLASLEDNNANIDVKTAKIDVDLKKLAFEQQEKNVERLEKQYKSGIINLATLDKENNTLKTKQLEYQSAKATLEGKEYILRSTKITAPFEGIITKVEKSLGDYVNLGTTVFQITEAKNFKIYAQVSVTYFNKFKVGMTFEFIDPINKSKGEAIVKRMVSIIDTSSKTFDIYADILNSKEKVTPGTYLEIKLNP